MANCRATAQPFADLGLKIDVKRGCREKFAEALASVETPHRLLRVSQTGWAADGKAFALPHKTISAPGVEPIVFEGRSRVAHFGEAGNLSGWRENVAKLAEGQDRLLLALGLALSGPLLDPLGLSGGGFHLVGASSIGKTSAERLAGSCWGGGGPLGFAQTWKATAGALEATAAAHSDAFLALDEIKLCEPNDVGTAAYVIAGGEGKSRLRSDSELRARLHWRIALLSSGEMSLAARIAEGTRQNKAHGGQAVRIVELQADAGCGFGIFDHVPGGDARALADKIRDATGVYYGCAGPAFVEILLNKRSETVATAKTIIKTFIAEHVPAGASGQVWRVAERFALVAAAGEIAIGVNILPFKSGAILDATARLFKGWIAERGGLGASEARAAVDAVRLYIQAHGKSRFIRLDDEGGESHSFRVQNAAGYYSHMKGLYYFNDFGWQEALAGLERRAVAEALFAAGFLLKDNAGKTKRAERGGGKTCRVFVISDKILEGDDNV